MMRVVWVDGRLSWDMVGVIVFLSVSILALDMMWRLVQIQFDTLLIYAAFAEAAAAVAIILVVRSVRRRSRGRRATLP